jgi:hypothetical protein
MKRAYPCLISVAQISPVYQVSLEIALFRDDFLKPPAGGLFMDIDHGRPPIRSFLFLSGASLAALRNKKEDFDWGSLPL